MAQQTRRHIEKTGDRLVAVGERGFVLVSDDAGKTWKAVGTPVVRALTGVAFNGDKLGVAVGHGGSLVRTEDGGSTWNAVPMDEAYGESLLGVTALGDGKFAAYGAFGQYFDTLDDGKSWTKRTIISEEFENHISQVVPVDGTLWMVTEYGTIARCDAECGIKNGEQFGVTTLGSLTTLVRPQDANIVSGGPFGIFVSPTVSALFRFNHGQWSWTGFVDALREDGLAKVLAEPTLIAMSGQTAKFLAGGEFPVPVPQGLGTAAIEYKQFGVMLSFTPMVLSEDKISIKVAPEVS